MQAGFRAFVEGNGSNVLKGETMAEKALPHVVIVGGGFGGLATARALRHAPVRVTVIDRSNHHLFQPLLYQVAPATLAPGDIAAPIRHLLRRQRNVTVAMAEVTGVDAANRQVLVNYLGRPAHRPQRARAPRLEAAGPRCPSLG